MNENYMNHDENDNEDEIELEVSLEDLDELVNAVATDHPIEDIEFDNIKYAELVSFQEAFPVENRTEDNVESKKLENIAKNQYDSHVKEDQDALKSVIMAEFNLTEEMAKALSTEIRSKALQLQNHQNSSPAMSLPEVAPELYDGRPINEETGKRETPIKFYERVWKEYADAGVLFQDSLRKLDSKLVDAIHSYCQRNSLAASDHLPPPKSKRIDALISSMENYNSEEKLKAAVALKRRRERELHKK